MGLGRMKILRGMDIGFGIPKSPCCYFCKDREKGERKRSGNELGDRRKFDQSTVTKTMMVYCKK